MADHAYLSVKPANFSEYVLHQDLFSFFSFYSQHKQLRCSLLPVGSLKWGSSKFLRLKCVFSLFPKEKDSPRWAGL